METQDPKSQCSHEQGESCITFCDLASEVTEHQLYSSSQSSYKPKQIQSEGMYTHLSM